ncbi:delta subunit of the central stalk of mitochondrial F1F0 ATP synthase, atp16 [Sorochytrium milnesiophthora]
MFALRSAIRPLARTYATEAAKPAAGGNHRLVLSFVAPHQALYSKKEVKQVNLAAVSGDMGILANHVPVIEQLRPGMVEVVEQNGQKNRFFVSGGFAFVHPDSSMSINAVEAFTLDQFDAQAVRANLDDANRRLSATKDTAQQAEIKIEIQVYSSLDRALSAAK